MVGLNFLYYRTATRMFDILVHQQFDVQVAVYSTAIQQSEWYIENYEAADVFYCVKRSQSRSLHIVIFVNTFKLYGERIMHRYSGW